MSAKVRQKKKMNKVTFTTSEKTPEKVKSKNMSMRTVLTNSLIYKQSTGGEILMSSSDTPVYYTSDFNGLVGTVVGAYNKHHNVVLSPEHFWIAVLTQFSQFVNVNSEKLRNTFVDFEGQRQLVVKDFGELRNAPYDKMAVNMTNQIAKNLRDPSIREWILPSFTTTTSNDSVVCSVVMMAAMQKYFKYRFELSCGIPSVTLLGTTDDYVALAKRVDKLLEFDADTGLMVKWHKLLKPIFTELINASEGKADPNFWSRVCSNHGGGSGPSYISGWITAFCCFNEEGKWQGDKFEVKFYTGKSQKSDYPIVNTDAIPNGLVTVPVVVDDNGKEHRTQMIAGSFCSNLVDPFTLQPRLDWCIGLEDEDKKKNADKF